MWPRLNVKLFGVQARREITKPLQFLRLIKAAFDCGGNIRQHSVNMNCHEKNSLDPRENYFLKFKV
jgi:hypothetical protein